VIDPVIVVQPVSVTNSVGANVTFSVVATGSGPLNYQWQQDGFDLPDKTDSSLSLTNIQDSDEGEYTVIVYNNVGETISDTATLTLTHPPVIVTQPMTQTVKQAASVTFIVSATGFSPFSYQWLFNSANIANATNRILSMNLVTTNKAGNYQVVVSNPFGTQTSQVAILTVAVPPAITVQPSSLIALAGQTASFSVAATGTPLFYQWHWGNTSLPSGTGSILTIGNVSTNNAGTYFVTVTNIGGTVTSTSVTLAVYDTAVPVLTMASDTNHQFRVTLVGVPGYTYSIESSSDLHNWTPLVTNASPFSVTETNRFNNKFYRGHYLP
jgi:hypothetical protein